MGCKGGFSLDENVRRSWFDPEKMLVDVGLCSGMVFADVGGGDGFFTLLAAKVVGVEGRVYAVDADVPAIERLKRRAAETRLTNVRAVAASAEETVFCDACADIVFYSIVLHDFRDPAKVLQNGRRMLKPSGTLVDLDWKKRRMAFGPPFEIRFSEEQASTMIERSGFVVKSVRDIGSYHYLVVAQPSPKSVSR